MSLAVVTVSDEEGEIDILVRSDIWPGDFCAPRIWGGRCPAFQPELEVLEKEDSTRSVLKNARSQYKAHHWEQHDMLTIFRVTCWELEYPQRWQQQQQFDAVKELQKSKSPSWCKP